LNISHMSDEDPIVSNEEHQRCVCLEDLMWYVKYHIISTPNFEA
jgi:hypothetical protein